MKNPMKIFDAAAFTTVVGGALCTGIKGLFGTDLMAVVLGDINFLIRIVYILIGAAAVYQLSQFRVVHKRWAEGSIPKEKANKEKKS